MKKKQLDLGDLEELLNDAADEIALDWSLKIEVGCGSAYCIEVRITRMPNNPDGPDHSDVFLVTGGSDASDCARLIFPTISAYLSSVSKPAAVNED